MKKKKNRILWIVVNCEEKKLNYIVKIILMYIILYN